jgi:hypothetical protein
MGFPRIDNLIEHWATIYKPIQHDPRKGAKARRFFRFNSLPESQDIGTKFNTAKTPLCGIVTQFDGVSRGKLLELTVVVYVFTKQLAPVSSTSDNEISAADAKIYGAEIINDLWVWLREQKRTHGTNPKDELYWLAGMDLDNIEICSEDRHYNGWWPTFICLKCQVPRQTCSEATKYLPLAEEG